MAKLQKKKEDITLETNKVEPEIKVEPKMKKQVEAPVEPLVSFDKWFAAKGFKFHWKAGMKAYTDTTFKKTFSNWEKTFKNY